MRDIQKCVGCKNIHGGEYGVDLLLGGLLGELVVPARHILGILAGQKFSPHSTRHALSSSTGLRLASHRSA